jgi:DNA-binding NarL/FixJ family response regulator
MGLANRADPLRVVVLEPHPLAARWLVAILSRDRGLAVSVVTVSGFASSAARPNADVLAADTDAVEVPLALYVDSAYREGRAALLAVGRLLDNGQLRRLVPRGLRGFVAYDAVERDLGVAVTVLATGRVWFRPEILEQYLLLCSSPSGPDGGLSLREEEVVALAGRGLSNKEIASALAVTERTVRFHLQNAFAKLGVHDRRSLVHAAQTAAVGPGSRATPK